MKNKLIKQAKKGKDYKSVAKYKTTLKWVEVSNYSDGIVKLTNGKKTEWLTGIRIMPRSIFLESPEKQHHIIERLRIVYNKLNFEMTMAFVHNKADLSEHINYLTSDKEQLVLSLQDLERELEAVSDDMYSKLARQYQQQLNILQMIESDLEKANLFTEHSTEVNFLLMTKHKNDFVVNKRRVELLNEFKAAGFDVSTLSIADIENYFGSVFENNLITEYVFSKYTPAYDVKDEVSNESTLI